MTLLLQFSEEKPCTADMMRHVGPFWKRRAEMRELERKYLAARRRFVPLLGSLFALIGCIRNRFRTHCREQENRPCIALVSDFSLKLSHDLVGLIFGEGKADRGF
jgi:hypothetical protein